MARKYFPNPRRFKRKRVFAGVRKKVVGRGVDGRIYATRMLTVPGVHNFKRTYSLTNANVSSAVSSGASISYDSVNKAWILGTGTGVAGGRVTYHSLGMFFSLDNMPDLTDFTNLFDSYKLRKVKVKIIPFTTSVGAQAGISNTTNNQPLSLMCYTVIDRDDYTAFAASGTGIEQAQQYPSIKVRNPYAYDGKPISRYFTPCIAQSTYAGALSSGYTTSKPRWLDLANTKIEHYGFKALWEVFTPEGTIDSYLWFKIEVTYYMGFKGVR